MDEKKKLGGLDPGAVFCIQHMMHIETRLSVPVPKWSTGVASS